MQTHVHAWTPGMKRPALKDCHTGLGMGHISNRDCLCTTVQSKKAESSCPPTRPRATPHLRCSSTFHSEAGVWARLSANPPKQDFFFNF